MLAAIVLILLLQSLILILGGKIMSTVQNILSRQTDLNTKLDQVIANQTNPPPPLATQSDLDAIAANVETANTKADQLLAPPAP